MERITLIAKYKASFQSKKFLTSLFTALFFLISSLVVNYYAVVYATESSSGPVTDIILSNTKVYDVSLLFVYGSIAVSFFIFILCILEPKRIPFIVKTISLFVIIRSAFIIMTHIGPFPSHLIIDSHAYASKFLGEDLFFTFFTGNDLFFSGHTGLPFLMALIFWNNKNLRYVFMFLSVLFGIVVLLAHLHYSIDVMSAFFITYTIYHSAHRLFKEDWEHANLKGLGYNK